MKKDAIRMIAFDMDGTVLYNGAEITLRLQDILRRAMEQGIYVVPCTGRGRLQLLLRGLGGGILHSGMVHCVYKISVNHRFQFLQFWISAIVARQRQCDTGGENCHQNITANFPEPFQEDPLLRIFPTVHNGLWENDLEFHVSGRILSRAVEIDTEVQVVTSRPAGRAYITDDFTLRNLLSNINAGIPVGHM